MGLLMEQLVLCLSMSVAVYLLVGSVPAVNASSSRDRSGLAAKLVCPPGSVESENEPPLEGPGRAAGQLTGSRNNHTECYVQVKVGCYMAGRCLSRKGIQGMPGLCQTLDRKYVGLHASACSSAARGRLHQRAGPHTTPLLPSVPTPPADHQSFPLPSA
ncbi:uncharacterized protein LOC129590928 [Paramacrobiotus metropolitanus]|uniref:uncharacterized protein LOC129590928 n=1 Tax=Paramacrobiotus metropolitanus TaxID=2943436 RepID=UPI0024461029|nr:uncharacterized protein LOC129590928 [Paramacrobiotus metropolitanus]